MYEFTLTGQHLIGLACIFLFVGGILLFLWGRKQRKAKMAALDEFIQRVENGLSIIDRLDDSRYALVSIKDFLARWYNEDHSPQPDSPTETSQLPNSARRVNAVFINQNDPPIEMWMADADLILTPQGVIKNRHGEVGRIVPQNERRVECPNCGHNNKYKHDRSDTGWTGIICTGCQAQFSCSLVPDRPRCGNPCSRCRNKVTFLRNQGALVCSECHPLLFERFCKNLTKDEIPAGLFDAYLAHMPLDRNPRPKNPYKVGDEAWYGNIKGRVVELVGPNKGLCLFQQNDNSAIVVKPCDLMQSNFDPNTA